MKKQLLTPKRAEQIQREIYYSMPDHKKIDMVNDFYALANDLINSKTILINESKRTIGSGN